MIMAPEDMRPTLGQPYRHRQTGRVATLRNFTQWSAQKTDRTHGMVMLADDAGWEWYGGQADFWDEWIHAGAFDESRN